MKKRMKIIMIDDDAKFMEIFSMQLEHEFDISAFVDPRHALKHLQNNEADAVLLDLHMDVEDGFSVCAEIKKLKPTLPVFFLSSDYQLDNIEQSFGLGSADYFSKTIDPKELIIRLKGRLQPSHKKLVCGDVVMDVEEKRIYIGCEEVRFSSKEFDLVRFFMEHKNEVLHKE